ncbi:MAG: phosphoglycerate dehydrogenase [Gemmatimonadaceae bacterium]|nr:phosphoglycerate dehydrogenase [Gemmatimonadaceae bacterium]
MVRHRLLVTDDIDADGVQLLTNEPAFAVDVVPTLPAADLLARIGDYDAIVGRSATRISPELLAAGTRLKVVGRAGVGVDNVAVDVATARGIAVINAPAGNTVAVAELVFGGLIALLRHIPRATAGMHAGRWERADLMGHECKGRTLGIVGLGRIGSEVAQRAHAFGMKVLAYDPYIAPERFQALRVQAMPSLDALLADAQIVTLHTPLTPETTGMLGKRELGRLPAGAIVLNYARGGIVDEAALVAALQSGHLRGAALDAFPAEPLKGEHPLRQVPNLLLTPHLGASTVEAQRNVAVDVCVAVRDALLSGDLSRSLNVAALSGPGWADLRPLLQLAQRAAATARALLEDRGVTAPARLTVRCGPEVIGSAGAVLASACVGLLEGTLDQGRVNLINARALAETRGVVLATAESDQLGHPAAIEIVLAGALSEIAVGGMAPAGTTARLTRIGSFHVDVAPRGTLLILRNADVPGVIGRVGTLLGDSACNIAEYHQARLAQGGEALAAVTVDGIIPAEVRDKLLQLPDVRSATVVRFDA